MATGIWKPYSQYFGETLKWIAGKRLTMSEPLHAGNIEYSGDYIEDHQAVQDLCDRLNVGGAGPAKECE